MSHRVARFVVIGLMNAAISFGILNLAFYVFGAGKITASFIATSCALVFSFVMNRGFVFRARDGQVWRQALPFIVVTALGTLGVLNAVYILTLGLIQGHEWWLRQTIWNITHLSLSADFIAINLSTVAGALAAMVWNYNGYRWFVFKDQKATDANAEV